MNGVIISAWVYQSGVWYRDNWPKLSFGRKATGRSGFDSAFEAGGFTIAVTLCLFNRAPGFRLNDDAINGFEQMEPAFSVGRTGLAENSATSDLFDHVAGWPLGGWKDDRHEQPKFTATSWEGQAHLGATDILARLGWRDGKWPEAPASIAPFIGSYAAWFLATTDFGASFGWPRTGWPDAPHGQRPQPASLADEMFRSADLMDHAVGWPLGNWPQIPHEKPHLTGVALDDSAFVKAVDLKAAREKGRGDQICIDQSMTNFAHGHGWPADVWFDAPHGTKPLAAGINIRAVVAASNMSGRATGWPLGAWPEVPFEQEKFTSTGVTDALDHA